MTFYLQWDFAFPVLESTELSIHQYFQEIEFARKGCNTHWQVEWFRPVFIEHRWHEAYIYARRFLQVQKLRCMKLILPACTFLVRHFKLHGGMPQFMPWGEVKVMPACLRVAPSVWVPFFRQTTRTWSFSFRFRAMVFSHQDLRKVAETSIPGFCHSIRTLSVGIYFRGFFFCLGMVYFGYIVALL